MLLFPKRLNLKCLNLIFLDIDECQAEGTCSQFCENTVPGYKCSCVEGYRLGTDQRKCKATGFIVFSCDFINFTVQLNLCYIKRFFNIMYVNELSK